MPTREVATRKRASVDPTSDVQVPEKRQSSHADVDRAARGLMRVELRRKFRVLQRRLLLLNVLVVVSLAFGFYLADYLPDEQLDKYREYVQSKWLLVNPAEAGD